MPDSNTMPLLKVIGMNFYSILLVEINRETSCAVLCAMLMEEADTTFP